MSAVAVDFQKVASLSALRASGRLTAMIGAARVALFQVGDSVIATQGKCPHARGPIHEGELSGDKIVCPWHGYTFDLRTGACEDDDELTLTRYDVRIDGDDIWVKV